MFMSFDMYYAHFRKGYHSVCPLLANARNYAQLPILRFSDVRFAVVKNLTSECSKLVTKAHKI